MIKRFYFRLEHLATKKPIITSISVGLVLAYLPNIVLPKEINAFLQYHKLDKGIIIGIVAFQMFTFFITLFYFGEENLRKNILKKINAVLIKLNSPFEIEKAVSLSIVRKEKFYDSEMIKTFEEYNQILSEIKAKWPKKFKDLKPLINTKRIYGEDWIPESELNGVKISFLQLKERLI